MIIWTAIQRDVGSWTTNPITRQEYFATEELATSEAAKWRGYGIGKDIKIQSISVKESPDE